MIPPDTLDSLVAYLQDDAAIVELAHLRIYPGEMPMHEAAHQPRGAVVLRLTGGIGQTNSVPIAQTRVDVTCYGATPREARQLNGAVFMALWNIQRVVKAGALLNSAIQGGGPLDGRHPDTHAPMVWSSWLVNTSLITAL